MPAYAAKMTDQQIADVTNYIRNAWGNAAPLVTADQVAKARRSVRRVRRGAPQSRDPNHDPGPAAILESAARLRSIRERHPHRRSSSNTNFGISHL